MNSDKLHHFQTSTFFILSAKVLPQCGSMASMRFSLQPPTGGHSPREETAVSAAGIAGMSLDVPQGQLGLSSFTLTSM